MRHSLFVNTITTTKIKLKRFQIYFIKFDLEIDDNREMQKEKKKRFKSTNPELDESSMLDIPADPGQAEDNG